MADSLKTVADILLGIWFLLAYTGLLWWPTLSVYLACHWWMRLHANRLISAIIAVTLATLAFSPTGMSGNLAFLAPVILLYPWFFSDRLLIPWWTNYAIGISFFTLVVGVAWLREISHDRH